MSNRCFAALVAATIVLVAPVEATGQAAVPGLSGFPKDDWLKQ